MEERVFICEKSIYKSNLNNGLLALMSLVCVDERIPMFLEKDLLIKMVIKQLKQLDKAKFPEIASACEGEISKLLPNCDLTELRKLIIEYYIVENTTLRAKVEILNFTSVTSLKVLKYLDEQLYIIVLNCIYDLMLKAASKLSMEEFSKKIMVGKKTCEALYPEFEFDDAIEILATDIQTWIDYNLLNGFCQIEESEGGLYLKVTI